MTWIISLNSVINFKRQTVIICILKTIRVSKKCSQITDHMPTRWYGWDSNLSILRIAWVLTCTNPFSQERTLLSMATSVPLATVANKHFMEEKEKEKPFFSCCLTKFLPSHMHMCGNFPRIYRGFLSCFLISRV